MFRISSPTVNTPQKHCTTNTRSKRLHHKSCTLNRADTKIAFSLTVYFFSENFSFARSLTAYFLGWKAKRLQTQIEKIVCVQKKGMLMCAKSY